MAEKRGRLRLCASLGSGKGSGRTQATRGRCVSRPNRFAGFGLPAALLPLLFQQPRIGRDVIDAPSVAAHELNPRTLQSAHRLTKREPLCRFPARRAPTASKTIGNPRRTGLKGQTALGVRRWLTRSLSLELGSIGPGWIGLSEDGRWRRGWSVRFRDIAQCCHHR
jgi:hypothetical protein